jgi:type I restriction enzyme R subunit
VNPDGHRTAYLWERIWERDGWLEILGRYMVAEKNEKKKITKIIFPRYHQLDGTRRLRAAVKAEGPGGKYLIQHSAGSGKTNSIAWSAHFLADLHDDDHRKVFDSVLVVSDRRGTPAAEADHRERWRRGAREGKGAAPRDPRTGERALRR